jgi:predicted tellurium resistance membrane protein TerC
MEWLTSPEAWIALVSLTALEVVLGIDNIIFISILVSRLPVERRQQARVLGLGLAMLTRIALLLSLVWLMRLTQPLFSILSYDVSGRDLILVGGGLFLLVKSVMEIHSSMEEAATEEPRASLHARFGAVLIQIAIIDIVFSLDSVITAIGLIDVVAVMVLAIVIAVGVMLFAAKPIGDFVDRHPTIRMLALSFLILLGVVLIAEGLGLHVPRGYIYFAMAFSLTVEAINLQLRKRLRRRRTHADAEPPAEGALLKRRA